MTPLIAEGVVELLEIEEISIDERSGLPQATRTAWLRICGFTEPVEFELIASEAQDLEPGFYLCRFMVGPTALKDRMSPVPLDTLSWRRLEAKAA